VSWTGLVLFVLAALTPARSSQEPPANEGGNEGGQEKQEQQQEEKKDEKKEGEGQEAGHNVPAPEEPVVGTEASLVAERAGGAPVELTRPGHPAVVWPLSSDAIALHLRGIAEAHPAVAALEVVGRSTNGIEILALRLGLRSDVPGSEKPVLFLVDFQGPASAGPEAMLELAWELSAEFEHDERVRALLERTTLVLAPALDPDARADVTSAGASDAGHPALRFERNFPSGWQPDSVRPGSGRVPLSEPQTLAAARYLANLKGCAVLLGFTAPVPRGEPYPGAELPASDREVFAKLAAALDLEGRSALVPWFELGSPGGSLFDFAYQARGIYPLCFPLPSEEELAAGGLSSFGAGVVTRVKRCLALLPRVEIAQEGLERLGGDNWQLDVRIQNVGIVPTSSALARHNASLTDVSLRLEGAKLMATARKPSAGASYTDASFQVRTPLSGGTLAGGEGRWLRLFLEAAPSSGVRLTTFSAWAGSSAVEVMLP
jgi:hypothetical protein